MKKFIIILGAVIILLFITACVLFVYDLSIPNRPTNAVGGEICLYLLPFIAWVIYRNIKDGKRVKK